MDLLFIGAINKNNPPRGGEEYKNQLILEKIMVDFSNAVIIDTSNWKTKPRVWLEIIYSIIYSKFSCVLISASSASTYKLLKIISWLRPSLLTNSVYLVIGGYFPEGLKSGKYNWKIYEPLKHIVVEGNLLANQIRHVSQLINLKVISNFKLYPEINFIKNTISEDFKFVFVGRISQGKGITEIIKAIEILKLRKINYCVDFYGPIEDNYRLNVEPLNYKGFLDFQGDPKTSYLKLSEYDCMLFPTYWIGEGFPGVIIDAFISGLPVIATDWNMNSEIIEDGINGFLIEPKDANALSDKMIWVMENRDQLEKIRQNNLEKAKDYHIDVVWPKLMDCVLR